MPNVLIRNLDPEVHATLARRAAEAGQSLQQYITAQLTALAGRPTMAEVVDRIEQDARSEPRVRLGPGEAADIIREAREEHDQDIVDSPRDQR